MSGILTAEALRRQSDLKFLLVVGVHADGNTVEFGLNRQLLQRIPPMHRRRIGAAIEKIVKEDFQKGIVTP